MKHFFDQETNLDSLAKNQLLEAAKRELKQSQMSLNEMTSKANLVCFNASAANHYVPRGMESFITTHIFPVNPKQKKSFAGDFSKFLLDVSGDILGYVIENIQDKDQVSFLDILFHVKTDYFFEPYIITHFSYEDLVFYLIDFLKSGAIDDTSRKIEIFDEQSTTPWRTIDKTREFEDVDTSLKTPIILDKSFFNDIELSIIKQGQPVKVKTAFAKLKAVQANFNKTRSNTGELIKSQNKLFIKPADIISFKLASAQSRSLLGISYKNEFIPANKLITHEVALKFIKLDDIDFIRLKHEKKAIDLTVDGISGLEVNLDTQQTVIQRKVSQNEFHIARFDKIRLIRNDKSVTIRKTVPFNRGDSRFEQIQTLFGTRYTECEKARNILKERGEFGLLGTRALASGDITSHLVLANMNLLRFLPFNTQCVGIDPTDARDFSKASRQYTEWFQELKNTFQSIIDVSQTPNFTEHNFVRLTKNIQKFILIESVDEITDDTFESLIAELDQLTQYMDDFFKLNVYSELQDNLECETPTGIEEDNEDTQIDEILPEETDIRLDDETKDFLTQNYAFFNKRGLIQIALIRIERMLFFNKNIKPFVDQSGYQPDLIIYKDSSARNDNYKTVSYPALALDTVFEPSILSHDQREDELYFAKYMREFTQKTHQKALELNKSFHHQFKHTLAELTYIADEKLNQLNDELQFLEKPENKEAAYKQLLEKITKLYHQHLSEKRQNIEQLEKEKQEVTRQYDRFKSELEELIGESLPEERMADYLKSAPAELENLKKEILATHKGLLNQTSTVFNAYIRFHSSAIHYFNKILKYANLFLKALWVHHNRETFQIVKKESDRYRQLDPDSLADEIKKLESIHYDKTKESSLYKEIRILSQKIKKSLVDLSKIPVKGLYRSKSISSARLAEYLGYYKKETEKLVGLIRQIQPVYQTLSKYQNQLFKKQEEYVFSRLERAKNELRLDILKLISENPDCESEIDALKKKSEKVPKEIKDELGALRSVLVESVNDFKEKTQSETIKAIFNYDDIDKKQKYRDQLNETTKELVNFSQGLEAIEVEKKGELADLEYLESQESNLENVAMSKALPSTRILLKTQYIPLVEKEKAILSKANQFLSEIISKEEAIRNGLISAFFKSRYGSSQFLEGAYCLDVSRSTKDHTERNINSAYMLIAERFEQSCAIATANGQNISMKKIEIQGIESLRNRISQTWHGHTNDRFIYLPSTFSINEALELCEYKDLITTNNRKEGKSKHSLVLIYVNRIRYEEIDLDQAMKDRYNAAILSNIFVNIDDVSTFNNRESIYEACIRETFGNCSDDNGSEITQKFLYG